MPNDNNPNNIISATNGDTNQNEGNEIFERKEFPNGVEGLGEENKIVLYECFEATSGEWSIQEGYFGISESNGKYLFYDGRKSYSLLFRGKGSILVVPQSIALGNIGSKTGHLVWKIDNIKRNAEKFYNTINNNNASLKEIFRGIVVNVAKTKSVGENYVGWEKFIDTSNTKLLGEEVGQELFDQKKLEEKKELLIRAINGVGNALIEKIKSTINNQKLREEMLFVVGNGLKHPSPEVALEILKMIDKIGNDSNSSDKNIQKIRKDMELFCHLVSNLYSSSSNNQDITGIGRDPIPLLSNPQNSQIDELCKKINSNLSPDTGRMQPSLVLFKSEKVFIIVPTDNNTLWIYTGSINNKKKINNDQISDDIFQQ